MKSYNNINLKYIYSKIHEIQDVSKVIYENVDKDLALDKLLKDNLINDKDYNKYELYIKNRFVTRLTVEIDNELEEIEEYYISSGDFYVIDSDGYQHKATSFDSALEGDTSRVIRNILGVSGSYTILSKSKLLLNIYFPNISGDLEVSKLAYSRHGEYIVVDIETGETLTNNNLD